MKLNKKLTAISAVALMGIAPFIASNTAQAADSSTINKTVMHNSVVYDKNGKNTGKMYKSYQKVVVESGIVKINGGQYYKLADKDQYIKITNIDGVERTVEHNAYVYATSTRRANSRLVKKGTTIVTYGGSYKFKNGKRYYRVGGPAKQYVKVANLGDEVTTSTSSNSSNSAVTNKNNTSLTNNSTLSSSDGETTITVTEPYPYLVGILDENGKVIQHNIKKGTKFIADRREITKFASEFPPGSITKGFYRIKGTNHWISAAYVKADKELPLHNYNDEHYSYIKFIQPTYVYNADGTIKSIPNKEVRKHGEFYKVDDLKYIWVPSENKAELFYRLPVTVAMGMYELGYSYSDTLKIKDIYVKADDVKFVEGIKLTPSNTPEEAKAAYEVNQANTAVVNSNN